jgi:protein SCO1/2
MVSRQYRRRFRVVAALWLAWTATITLAEPDRGHHTHHGNGAPETGYTRSLRPYSIPDVSLLNAAGQPVVLRALLATDKPVLLNFVYTSCNAICPVMTAVFAQAQGRLGVDEGRVRMVSVSIDPEYDTPERLREYAHRFRAGSDWHFLTGEQAQVVRLQHAFDAYRGGKANHTPLTLLRSGAHAPWVRLDGLASAEQLVRELAALRTP